jgi:hypothetical protein
MKGIRLKKSELRSEIKEARPEQILRFAQDDRGSITKK